MNALYIIVISFILLNVAYCLAHFKHQILNILNSFINNFKKILLLPLLFIAFQSSAQIPVVDLFAALIESLENLQNVQEIMIKVNENATEKQGVQNQRKIQLQLQKINKLYRTVNETLHNSELNDISKLLQISESLSTDLNDYLDVNGVDELTGFGIMDSDLSNISVADWSENLDYDILGKLSTENSFDENVALLQANYNKKLNIEKFASKFTLQSAISNFQLADEYEARAIELDNLINGVSLKIHSLEEMNITMMDVIPDLMAMVPAFDKDCDNFSFWVDSLAILNEDLENITLEKEMSVQDEDMEYYEELVYKELITIAEIENYQLKINNCNTNAINVKNRIEEQMDVIQGFFDEVAGAMEGLGLFASVEEIQSEPDLNVNDGERIKLMQQRDEYFTKSKDLRMEGAQLIEEANQSTDMSKQEMKLQSMKRFTNQVTENLR